MKLIETILASLPVEPIPVRRLVIGVHWTMVSSMYSGLGSTIVGDGPHGHSRVRDVGSLHLKSAQELAHWVLSDNLLEASIGIAALNSLLPLDESQLTEVNAADVIARQSAGKNLAVVGHFPFVDQVRSMTKNCWVIEKRPFGEDFPEKAAAEFIPQADVVAITGTAFINHSIEMLLSLCPTQAQVMILGPSTPLTPLLFNARISFLSGARVFDEQAAVNTIQQGAIFRQVQGVRLLTMTPEYRQSQEKAQNPD